MSMTATSEAVMDSMRLTWSSDPRRGWKVKSCLAVLMGLLGWTLDVPVTVMHEPIQISFAFGSVFPLMVAMAWGGRYALLAATLGLGAQGCWWNWPNNGWANIPAAALMTTWMVWHGWASRQRSIRSDCWWLSSFIVQAEYTLVFVAAMSFLFWGAQLGNPAPWTTHAQPYLSHAVVFLITVKSLINQVLVLLVVEVLFHLALMRRLWNMPLNEHARHDTWVMAGAIGVAILAWGLDALVMCLLGDAGTDGWWRCCLPLEKSRLVSRMLLVVVCLASGIMVARLIRRRVHMESLVRSSENDLRTTLNSMGDAVIVTTIDGYVVRMNPASERLTGWLSKDALGQRFSLVAVLGDASSAVEEQEVDAIAWVMRNRRCFNRDHHIPLTSRDGILRLVAESAAPIHRADGGISGVVVVMRDVTEQEALAQRLRRAERLEAIGLLAGGIAHDFNNMLTAIMGAAELLKERARGRADLERPVVMVLGAAQRAAALTRKLVSFARPTKACEVDVDLHREISDAVALLERTVDARISMRCELLASHFNLLGDPSLIQNAIMNLVINARDAMSQGGTLVLATRDVPSGDPLLVGMPVNRSYVSLAISDTGCGIPDEIRAHLFEPFVSSKPAGKGTGLGLSSVHGTVQSHHGSIRVESQRGHGTTFTLVLPVSSPGFASSSAGRMAARSIWPSLKGMTVLIADDQESVRGVIAEQIQEWGATVVMVDNGAEAVRLFQQNPHRFDLVLLDQVMPGLSGAEAFGIMHRCRPEVPVSIISGYLGGVSIPDLMRDGLAGYLPKPFTQVDLARLLNAQLIGRDQLGGESDGRKP